MKVIKIKTKNFFALEEKSECNNNGDLKLAKDFLLKQLDTKDIPSFYKIDNLDERKFVVIKVEVELETGEKRYIIRSKLNINRIVHYYPVNGKIPESTPNIKKQKFDFIEFDNNNGKVRHLKQLPFDLKTILGGI